MIIHILGNTSRYNDSTLLNHERIRMNNKLVSKTLLAGGLFAVSVSVLAGTQPQSHFIKSPSVPVTSIAQLKSFTPNLALLQDGSEPYHIVVSNFSSTNINVGVETDRGDRENVPVDAKKMQAITVKYPTSANITINGQYYPNISSHHCIAYYDDHTDIIADCG